RRHLVIALGVPPLLTLPWTAGLLLHPSRFLTAERLHRGFAPPDAAGLPRLDPGGPGAPARWPLAGRLAVAGAALPPRGRRRLAPLPSPRARARGPPGPGARGSARAPGCWSPRRPRSGAPSTR